MRLTLRTLLAYLDDSLDANQAKEIGQKIAESETAQELIERIKQVTRRRHLAAPAPAGASTIDANTIAEYLDNKVTPEKAAEIEQICLESDIHLAEVAGCHQILALVLGEPALVPPTAKQRMYGLVKGPEANPRRKPPRVLTESESWGEGDDLSEALRVLRKASPARTLLIAIGGVAAACLLVFALWQVLAPGTPEPRGPVLAQADGKKPVDHKEPDKDEPRPNETVKPNVVEPQPPAKKEPAPVEPMPKLPEVTPGTLPPAKNEYSISDIPFAPPNNQMVPVGQYQVTDLKEPGILLQSPLDKNEWKRVSLQERAVYSGRSLVSMPGSKSVVEIKPGLRLTLWGHLPEIWPLPFLLESRVDLHQHDQIDLDLTLRRGRIVIASTRDRPTLVRLRFENPTEPSVAEHVDLTLAPKGTEILVDRMSVYPPNEPFYKDPKNPSRQGPVASMGFWVLKGSLEFKHHYTTYGLSEAPGSALVVWNSREKLISPQTVKAPLPDGIAHIPPQVPNADPKIRAAAEKAVQDLGMALSTKAADVALLEAIKSMEPPRRTLAVRCLGAIDDLGGLCDALGDQENHDVRQAVIMTMKHWVALSRDSDYKLWDALKSRFSRTESEKIMELMHGFTHVDVLIDYLDNSLLTIRELAILNLYQMIPQGQVIRYDPTADAAVREQAQQEWRALVKKLLEKK